jgi:hypothetical protein
VQKTVFDSKEEYFKEMRRQNPNICLESDDRIAPALADILANQKDLIQKDGNLCLKGIVIKGAPSLGTKFNPNFKDPARNRTRPKSRGLT